MRIGLGYIYNFYELTGSEREYFLISSFAQDLRLYELRGKTGVHRKNIVELELPEHEGKGKFTITGFNAADDYHLWFMVGLTFLNLHEKRFMLMEQELEDRKRKIIARRVPY